MQSKRMSHDFDSRILKVIYLTLDLIKFYSYLRKCFKEILTQDKTCTSNNILSFKQEFASNILLMA